MKALLTAAGILLCLSCNEESAVTSEDEISSLKEETGEETAGENPASGQESGATSCPSGDTAKTCAMGYIAHGLRLEFSPRDNPKAGVAFKDAQDLSDRFDTAFLLPFMKEKGLETEEYRVSFVPPVTTFAVMLTW